MHRIFIKYIDIHCGFKTSTSYQSPAPPLTFTKITVKEGNYTHLIGVICVECLVGKNTTNQSMNEICNGCLYLVIDLPHIFGIVYSTLCNLSKSSLIVWSETDNISSSIVQS